MAQLGWRPALPAGGGRAAGIDRGAVSGDRTGEERGLEGARGGRRALFRRDRPQRRGDADAGPPRARARRRPIRERTRRLAAHDLALENLGDVDAQSIAGAISTATHGTGARLRNISAQVTGLTLVLADGSKLVCSPEHDPEV